MTSATPGAASFSSGFAGGALSGSAVGFSASGLAWLGLRGLAVVGLRFRGFGQRIGGLRQRFADGRVVGVLVGVLGLAADDGGDRLFRGVDPLSHVAVDVVASGRLLGCLLRGAFSTGAASGAGGGGGLAATWP